MFKLKTKSFFLKNILWKQLLILFLFQFLPTLYKTTRLFFLGTLPSENAFNIASQILWLNIIFEIVIESIIVPIFFIFEKIKNEQKDNIVFHKEFFTIMLVIVFLLFLVFTITIFFFIDNILINNKIDINIFNETSSYIKIEVFSLFLYSVLSFLFCIVCFYKFKYYNLITFIVSIIYTLTNLIIDLFLVANFSFSLKLGVIGIGISSLMANLISIFVLLFYLLFPNNKLFIFKRWSNFKIIKQYLKKYCWLWILSAVEVSIRNLFFYFMIIVPINNINNSGVYWVTNNFIWNWLLLPITTLSTYIKINFKLRKDCNSQNEYMNQYKSYFLIVSIVIIFWISFIWLNPYFIRLILNEKEFYNEVNRLVLILIGFYICFAYAMVIDAIFIKSGKINLYLLQSIIVNILVYPICFILYKLNLWIPTLDTICIMFGSGMLLHTIINILFLLRTKQEKKRLINR